MPDHQHPVNRILDNLIEEYKAAGFPENFPTSGNWVLIQGCHHCFEIVHTRADYRATPGHLTPDQIAHLADRSNRVRETNECRHMYACSTCLRRVNALEVKEQKRLVVKMNRHIPRGVR